MRVRQVLSYAGLLDSAVVGYTEDLLSHDPSLASLILSYDQLETPGKMTVLMREISALRETDDRKVVVWSGFVRTLYRIRAECGDERMGG